MKPANNAPLYLCIYAGLAEITRANGYALAVHGSLARDCDLICVPWVDDAKAPVEVVQAILAKYAVELTGGPDRKPQGRIAYTLHMGPHGDVYFDLQFMPRVVQ